MIKGYRMLTDFCETKQADRRFTVCELSLLMTLIVLNTFTLRGIEQVCDIAPTFLLKSQGESVSQ